MLLLNTRVSHIIIVDIYNGTKPASFISISVPLNGSWMSHQL